jgi:hypothetical protein
MTDDQSQCVSFRASRLRRSRNVRSCRGGRATWLGSNYEMAVLAAPQGRTVVDPELAWTEPLDPIRVAADRYAADGSAEGSPDLYQHRRAAAFLT